MLTQREIELLRRLLDTSQRDKDAVQQEKLWFMQQLEQVTQRRLPPPKKPFLDRLAEAWGRFRRQ
jgi:hypothetical protein